jgi:hypothetical protein
MIAWINPELRNYQAQVLGRDLARNQSDNRVAEQPSRQPFLAIPNAACTVVSTADARCRSPHRAVDLEKSLGA